jgi:hypothetical protein
VVRKAHARTASRLVATLDLSFRTEPSLPNNRLPAVAFWGATVSGCHSPETRIKLWSRLSSV